MKIIRCLILALFAIFVAGTASASSPQPVININDLGINTPLDAAIPESLCDLYAKIRFIGDPEEDRFGKEEGGIGHGSNIAGGPDTPDNQEYVCDKNVYTMNCAKDHIPKVGVGGSCGYLYSKCMCPQKYRYLCDEPNVVPVNSDITDSCQDSGKPKYFKKCECAPGFTISCPSEKMCGSSGECNLPHSPGGPFCRECVCRPEYIYNSGNCNGDYAPSGGICEGNYNQCVCIASSSGISCGDGYECSSRNCAGACTGCSKIPDPPPDPCENYQGGKTCSAPFPDCIRTDQCGGCSECGVDGTNPNPTKCTCSEKGSSCTNGVITCSGCTTEISC